MSTAPTTSVSQILREAQLLSAEPSAGASVAILPMGSEHPEGYQVLEVINGNFNIDQFSEGECVEILAPNLLNLVEFSSLNTVISKVLSKLRAGGTLVIGGTDANMLARAIINNTVNLESLNQHIYNTASITDLQTSVGFLKSLGLKIISANYNGLTYEIKSESVVISD